ncbi:MAG: glycosyltransferase family 2 protein [Ardenticatenaceae bacterium]|nr:glycosyltransferase family 2 protein [Ardenticatenaceae bacterium]
MSKNHAPQLSVVLPVYRSKDILQALVMALTKHLQLITPHYEIIFVNDGCPDGSSEKLRELTGKFPRLTVIDLAKNVGQHRAVLTGLAQASGQYVAIMDADLQDPPQALPLLMAKIDEGYAAVFAGRRGRYERADRLLTSRVFKRALHLLTGVPADAGMYVMLERSLVQQVILINFFFPFVVAMIGCVGRPITSLPVVRNRRPVGESAYSSLKRLKTAVLALSAVLVWKVRKRKRYLQKPYQAPISQIVTPSKDEYLKEELNAVLSESP